MNDADIGIQSTALIILPPAQFPTIIAADKDDILGKLAEELRGFKGDVTTDKGRREIASKAHKVSVAKMDLVRLFNKLKEDAQKLIKGVNAERNQIEERMDGVRDQVRKPLDDFEAMEAARVKGHDDAIAEIAAFERLASEQSSVALSALIDDLDHLHPVRNWQEFDEKAAYTRKNARNTLLVALSDAKTREAAEAEAKRLAEERAERDRQEAARQQAEREAEIKRQAAEEARLAAEQAAADEAARVAREAEDRRLKAEQDAQAERKRIEDEAAEAASIAEHQRLLIQAEVEAAKARAAQLEEEREATRVKGHQDILARIARLADGGVDSSAASLSARISALEDIDQSGHDYEEFTTQAITEIAYAATTLRYALEEAQDREAAEAERQKKLAEQRAEAIRLAAIAEEQKRAEAARVQEARDAKLREENKQHRAKINREAVADLVAVGLTDDAARAAVTLIAKGGCRHVTIRY